MSDTVLVARDGAIVTVTLNRPERRNGLTVEACTALYEALREIAASDARVVILRGAGSDFCVGADVHAAATQAAPSDVHLSDLGQVHHAATLLHTMPQVTIAAIDGGCAGAGMGYAAACDLRFATAEARFAAAFLKVGVSGDMGLAWSLVRLVGAARARELLFFGEKFTGEQALAFGLVTRLFPRDGLYDETRVLAHQLCALDPFALKMMKANLISAERSDLAEFVDIETARHLHTTTAPGFRRNFRQD